MIITHQYTQRLQLPIRQAAWYHKTQQAGVEWWQPCPRWWAAHLKARLSVILDLNGISGFCDCVVKPES